MSYNREQWEEVSFQVIEQMDGSVRSGYFPTGEGLVSGNVAIDHAFGNFPIQPNEDRGGLFVSSILGVLDSHKIATTEWNAYPQFNGSRNYKVTAAKYLGGDTYEYTSQNNLQVGDFVNITGCDDLTKNFNSSNREVIYADATKFRTSDELSTGEITGIYYGRVEVLSEYETGHTLYQGEGDKSFQAPNIGLFSGALPEEAKLENYFDYLREMGVNPEFLKDITFSGGDHEWDHVDGTSNDDGCVLYSYIPADVYVYDTPQGTPVYGSDLDGVILTSLGFYTGDLVSINGIAEDYMVVVFSNDPRKNNNGWW